MKKRTKASRRRAALKGWRNRREMFKAFGELLGGAGFKIVNEDKRTGLVVAKATDPIPHDGWVENGQIGYVWRPQWGISRGGW